MPAGEHAARRDRLSESTGGAPGDSVTLSGSPDSRSRLEVVFALFAVGGRLPASVFVFLVHDLDPDFPADADGILGTFRAIENWTRIKRVIIDKPIWIAYDTRYHVPNLELYFVGDGDSLTPDASIFPGSGEDQEFSELETFSLEMGPIDRTELDAMEPALAAEHLEVFKRKQLEHLLGLIASKTEQVTTLKGEIDAAASLAKSLGASWNDLARAAGVAQQTAYQRWSEKGRRKHAEYQRKRRSSGSA